MCGGWGCGIHGADGGAGFGEHLEVLPDALLCAAKIARCFFITNMQTMWVSCLTAHASLEHPVRAKHVFPNDGVA